MDTSVKIPGASFTYGEYRRWWAWRNRQGRSGFSPVIQLTIDYTTTQFAVKWKAPASCELIFNWGDGTTSTVSGNDAVLITTTSSYSGAGTYSFYLTGDVSELTYIDIGAQLFVSGDISGWGTLTNLTNLRINNTGVTGSINGLGTLTKLIYITCKTTAVTGDISNLATLTNLATFQGQLSSISGDASALSTLTKLVDLRLFGTGIDFDNAPTWVITNATVSLYDCAMSSTMVDNMLASFAATPLTGCTINVAGTNAARTAASDADKAIIIDVGNSNTLTVNE